MSIPILDLQDLPATTLDNACRQWGFFALAGHGIDEGLISEVLTQAQGFFAQTIQTKNEIRRSADNAWGFYDAELTKNRRDWKEIVDIGPPVREGPLSGATPQWPQLAGFKDAISSLTTEMHRVSIRLVAEIASSLGVSEDLTLPFQDHSSFLRLNYYPPCPDPAPDEAGFQPSTGQLGISHHTDAGAVTVLLQDAQPGLQVYRNERWHTVPVTPGTLIINIGDIVQVWSNDRYQAPLHRVLANSEAPRISVPYFLNPDYDYDYAPLQTPHQTQGKNGPHYQAINWGAFRQQRSAGDYADYGAEVQISDYRV
jgi:isopenicillin N synthase-like dioxygenase